jgi:hypothetical protein
MKLSQSQINQIQKIERFFLSMGDVDHLHRFEIEMWDSGKVHLEVQDIDGRFSRKADFIIGRRGGTVVTYARDMVSSMQDLKKHYAKMLDCSVRY